MPYALKPNKFWVKNPNAAGYLPQNAITDATTAEQVAAIEEKGAEVLASIPSDYTELINEVGGLKSAIEHYYTVNSYTFVCGGIYNGSENSDTNRIRTPDFIRVFPGMHIVSDASYANLVLAPYNANKQFLRNESWTNDYTIQSDTAYVKIILRKAQNATIDASEFEGLKATVRMLYDFVPYVNWVQGQLDGINADTNQLDSDITDIENDLSLYKSDIAEEIGCSPIVYNTSGKSYNLSGTSVTIENGVPKPSGTDPLYKSGYVACVAGDVFTLNLVGGVSARAYAFVQSDGTIIEKSGESKTFSNAIFFAPENTAFLIVQTKGTASCYIGTTVPYRFEQLSQTDGFRYLVTNGYYTQQTETGYVIKNTVAVGAVVDLTPVASENMASIVVNAVSKGMKFLVFGTGTYNYVIWAWLDKDNRLISKANTWASSGATGVIIEAPQNAFRLVCSSNVTYRYGFNVQYIASTENLLTKIDNATTGSELIEPNLKRYADFSFSFFSDIHGGDVNFQRIIQHAEDNELDVIINGGDTMLNYMNDPNNPFSWYATDVNTSTVDILSAVGNHDVWDGAYWTKGSATDIYNAIVKPLVTKFTGIVQPQLAEANGLCYYYKDYGTVRVIVINAMTGSTSVDFWDTAQATWFENVLADAKTNSKHVIVCNHAPFPKNIALRDEKSDWNSWIDYRTYPSSDDIVMKTEALNLIKTFTDGGGKLICLLTGHEHVDSILTATGYEGQFMFNTASAKYANHPDGLTYSSTDSKYYDCFNYCTVDTTHTILKVWRVGWCMDASMKKRELFSYNYSTNKILHE